VLAPPFGRLFGETRGRRDGLVASSRREQEPRVLDGFAGTERFDSCRPIEELEAARRVAEAGGVARGLEEERPVARRRRR
jgi:hypothetical protein